MLISHLRFARTLRRRRTAPSLRLPILASPLRYAPALAHVFGRLSIRLPRRNRTRISKLATAKFSKQMLHMPGVVHSSPPFPADTFQMAKTDDDFHFEYLHLFYRADFTLVSCAALRLVKDFTLVVCSAFASNIPLGQLFVQLRSCLELNYRSRQ